MKNRFLVQGLAALLALSTFAQPSIAGDIKGKTIQGNIVYTDTHEKRFLEAIGADVTKYLDDFTSGPGLDTTVDDDWTVTRVEAGAAETTVTRTDGVGGELLITNDANDNDGPNLQLIGESFKLASGNIVYFGIRLKVSEATQDDFFAGLAITDTDILGGVTDRIGFEKLDGVTTVKAMLEKDSTETLSGTLSTLNTSYHTYEFYYDGSASVEFFIDGVSVLQQTTLTNLPNDEELRVTVQFLNGDGNSRTANIDWIRVVQIGGRQ